LTLKSEFTNIFMEFLNNTLYSWLQTKTATVLGDSHRMIQK